MFALILRLVWNLAEICIKEILKQIKKGKILDAGCGIGRNSYYCLKNGAKEVHLFDVEESTVEIAKDNLKDFNNISIFKD